MRKQIAFLLLIAAAASPVWADVAEMAKSSGVQGGLVVHLGCGDGRETAKLRVNDRYLVHGLDTEGRNVLVARENIHALDLYGKVSIDRYDGSRLPYTESLVNLLIDSSEKTTVPHEEILRVLAPGGVAFVDGKKIVKPWPADIDQWTHYLHSADNNAVAADRQIDIPRSYQWVSGPRWGRSHEEMASMSAAVSAGGRVFFIVDEAPLASIRYQGNWKLVARDAFNGTLLWKKDIAQWNDVLRHFRSGPVHLPRRLVAVGDRVYVTDGLAGPVTVLDGATGETVTVLKGTERTDEILIDGGVAYLVVGTSEVYRRGGGLYRRGEPEPTDFRFITAINLESGKRLWKKDFDESEFLLPLSLAVKGKRLYYQSTLGIVCLDTASGQQQWKTARETPGRRMAFSAPTLVATDDVVLLADRDAGKSEENKPSTGKIEWGVHGWNEGGFPRKGASTLRAYSATDGKELWSAPCSEGYNSPVDIFVIDGTVWVGAGFNGYDLATGESRGKINTAAPRVGMPHHRCYRNKASERFIFTGKSGIEVLDPEKGWLSNNSWVRGTCQYGIMPANGLLYAPPDACACFLTLKAPGFFAVAPQRDESGHMPFPDEPVLEKGPLYGKPIPVADAKADDWPMYRHDVTRSGAIGGSIPEQPKKQWSVSIGGRLTQPVTAAGTVLVASIDTQTIHALAADDGGRELWRFTAGGRIDSSPTIYQGTVLFGSADGWVYCLGATDGRLVWRFQAAPTQRLIAAYGQLESAWPVHGSVLVQNDIVYVTAGRSTYTDGGIVLYRLDPASGKELSKTMLYHLDPDSGKQLTTEGGFNMEGTTTDLLTGDGDSVYLKYFCFNREGQRAPSTKPHLFAIAGLLGEEWFVRSYWVLGTDVRGAGWGGWANTANANPAGRILCFNDEVVYGYGRTTVSNGAVGHRADAYHLFGRSRKVATPPPPSKSTSSKGGRRGKPTPAKGEIVWSDTESLTARAMVLAADRLVVAGPVDLGEKTEGILSFKNEPEALAAFQGQKDICLRIISTADGKTISECKLDALPVFDGMSAAGGKIYVSLKDGTVVCFGK